MANELDQLKSENDRLKNILKEKDGGLASVEEEWTNSLWIKDWEISSLKENEKGLNKWIEVLE